MEGSLETLSELEVGRVIYTHLNHTNPLLNPGSPMLDELKRIGFEVAYDGMILEV